MGISSSAGDCFSKSFGITERETLGKGEIKLRKKYRIKKCIKTTNKLYSSDVVDKQQTDI